MLTLTIMAQYDIIAIINKYFSKETTMEEHIRTGIILAVLVLLSAFFSASETAYTSANRIRLKSRAENGSKKAERALMIIEHYDKTLTTILIGNNIVNILTSSLATVLCIALFGEKGTLISTAAVTVIVLIFGEILPKTIAKLNAESFACAISAAMKVLIIIFTPFSAFFILLQKAAARLFGGKRSEVSMNEEELMQLIDEIEDEGVLEEQESDLVRSALEFDETVGSAIITPRVNVAAAEINTGVEELRELFIKEGYSRIPVYEKTIDHIVGIVRHRDFFEKLAQGESFYVRDIVQETMFVPGLMKISDVLRKMQRVKAGAYKNASAHAADLLVIFPGHRFIGQEVKLDLTAVDLPVIIHQHGFNSRSRHIADGMQHTKHLSCTSCCFLIRAVSRTCGLKSGFSVSPRLRRPSVKGSHMSARSCVHPGRDKRPPDDPGISSASGNHLRRIP